VAAQHNRSTGPAGAIRFEVMRPFVLSILFALAMAGQTRTLTLKQAVDLALEQNPDLLLAKLDEQKAALGVQAVSEPLAPRVYAGSGLAYTYGFPVSLDGSAPSIVQARAERSIFNAPSRLFAAQAREQARGATLGTAEVREEVVLRTAVLFLDLERAVRATALVARQMESLARVEAAVKLRVAEGRELAIEGKRAAVNLARARQKLGGLEGAAATQGRMLALALGLPAGERIDPAMEERVELDLPASESDAIQRAVKESGQLRKLESDAQAQALAARANRARRLPSVNLVAQYSLLGKFNNYEDFFRRFQRHNAQIGASIAIPLWANPQDEAVAAQADVEGRRIRIQASSLRSRIESESRQAWQRVNDADAYREVAKLDLEVARDQVGVVLAQVEEGRAGLKQLEEARIAEQERWSAYYEAGYELEKARLEVLRRTNQLTASMR
jgi:outer membrane protein TolC